MSLLFVPLVASGHHHASHPASQPCASCVATHHTPTVLAPLQAPTLVPYLVGVEPVVFEAVTGPVEHTATNRGPPSFVYTQGT